MRLLLKYKWVLQVLVVKFKLMYDELFKLGGGTPNIPKGYLEYVQK